MAVPASASPFNPSGVIRLARHAHGRVAANKSTNWFGYSEGSLANGGTRFSSIGATWTVPKARQHARKEAEHSATWIGIGGGCIDARCSLTDPTGLIQTGTEQDVTASGRASYSAWWELVPVPAVTISKMAIKPGDRISASVSELEPTLWRITISDLSRHETFTTTTPYPSSRATAEWIEETPVTIGTGGTGVAALPKLTRAPFDDATVNGHPAQLTPAAQIRLTGKSGVIGAPSAPDSGGDGFGACAWASRCRVPRS
jgi:peptidase A4-like protein